MPRKLYSIGIFRVIYSNTEILGEQCNDNVDSAYQQGKASESLDGFEATPDGIEELTD